MGFAQGCCWYTQCHSIDENWFFSLLADINCQWFLGSGRTQSLFLLLQAGILLGLSLCRSCANCFWKMLFPDIVFAFYSLSTSFPLLYRFVSLEGRVVINISHWGLTESFESLILPNVSYGFVNYHLLQEASLMRLSDALICAYSNICSEELFHYLTCCQRFM